MGQSFYHYRDTPALTRSMLDWLADRKAEPCRSLRLSANSTLEDTVVQKLVRSRHARTIEALDFTEIYVSPASLKVLLGMPALVKFVSRGGVSYDWAGPEYVYPTLAYDHILVFAGSPHAQRLRVLELDRQELDESTGIYLRRALPKLTSLWIDGREY